MSSVAVVLQTANGESTRESYGLFWETMGKCYRVGSRVGLLDGGR